MRGLGVNVVPTDPLHLRGSSGLHFPAQRCMDAVRWVQAVKANLSIHSIYSTLDLWAASQIRVRLQLFRPQHPAYLTDKDTNSILLWTGFNLKSCVCVASIFHSSLSSFIRMQRARLASLSLCARVLYIYQMPRHYDIWRARASYLLI